MSRQQRTSCNRPEQNLSFRDMVNITNNLLNNDTLPDHNNTGFKTCSTQGTWKITRQNEDQIQMQIDGSCCSSCYGFVNKAKLMTMDYYGIQRPQRSEEDQLMSQITNSLRELINFDTEENQTFNIRLRRTTIESASNSQSDIQSALSDLIQSMMNPFSRNQPRATPVAPTTINTVEEYTVEDNTDEDIDDETDEKEIQVGEDFPNDFLCPINMTPMKDPVICVDGHSYERKAIKKWLKTHSKSPKTGSILQSKLLIPNISLRNAIQEYIKK